MSHGYDGLSSYGWKQGKWRQNWTRRYLVLRGDEILYYKSPQDAHARGTIALRSLQKVESSINPEEDGFPKDLYCLVLETPARNWKLGFEKPDDLASWLQMWVELGGGVFVACLVFRSALDDVDCAQCSVLTSPRLSFRSFAHYLKHTLKQSFSIEKGDILRASQRSGGPVFALDRGTMVPHSIHCFPGYHT